MKQGKLCQVRESGVSEVIGSVMLISVVVAAVAIIGATILMQPPPVKIPSLDATISSTGHTVQIYHNGGDMLQASDISILVDGAEVAFQKGGDPSWKTWSNGETLTYVSPGGETPQTVYVLYTLGKSSSIISSVEFGATGASATSRRITATAGTGGTIDPSGVINVVYGESRTFAITADAGYQILDVTVDGSSVGAVSSYTFSSVTSSHIIYATFLKLPVITATTGANGNVSPYGPVPVPVSGDMTFSITPETGYHISDVTVDSVSQGAISSYTFTNVQTDHTISATFAINTYTLTPSAGTHGMITPSSQVDVNYGGSQTFTITNDTHYHIADVLVDGTSVGAVPSYAFTNVAANHTIDASFAIDTYTISASAGNGGYIVPTGDVTVNYGSPQTFLIYKYSGYNIYEVLVDSVPEGALSSYTFPAVSANHTISASFVGIPQFSGISPSTGSTAGGTSVSITGTNLTGATSVTFGGTAASSFTVNNETSISATTPAHGAGVVNVVITTPGGTGTGTGAFTYSAPPTFASISPAGGPTAGGNSAIITGTGFTGATSVTFDGTPATSFTVNSATSITAVVPAHSVGTVDVVITTPAGIATGTGAYTYALAPTFSGVSPATGSSSGGTAVTITGTGFTGTTSVTFGGTAASTFTVDSATSISAVTAAHAAGVVDVVITTPAGTATGTNAYTYYTIQTFTSSTTWSVPSGVTTVEYLVVGGGGGGGRYGGGGGAGGFLTGTLTGLSGSQTVTVGAGGAGGTSTYGTDGVNSVFGPITAIGGGGGGGSSGTLSLRTGRNGGSGGGGVRASTPGGTGTSGQGNDGGAGYTYLTSRYNGGGGGGAGAAGDPSTAQTDAGVGGAGSYSSITGASVQYACGGGGGGRGAAGAAGCGTAGAGRTNAAGYSATDYYGGGGGGGGYTYNGGDGGNGVVIIKYY